MWNLLRKDAKKDEKSKQAAKDKPSSAKNPPRTVAASDTKKEKPREPQVPSSQDERRKPKEESPPDAGGRSSGAVFYSYGEDLPEASAHSGKEPARIQEKKGDLPAASTPPLDTQKAKEERYIELLQFYLNNVIYLPSKAPDGPYTLSVNISLDRGGKIGFVR